MWELQKHVLCNVYSPLDRVFIFFNSCSSRKNGTSGLRFLDYDAVNINGSVLFSCMYCFEKEINHMWVISTPYSVLEVVCSLFPSTFRSFFWMVRLLFASISFIHTHTLFSSFAFLVVTALSRRIHKLLHTLKSHTMITVEHKELILFFR